jgi:tetratricopeptide (TPR) repeat protein
VAAAALRPRSGPVRRALGDAYFLVADRGIANELASAIREYHAALERMRPTSALLNNLGNALRNSGRLEESIEVFRRAIRLEPENAIPHLNLALSYRNGGDLEKAIEEVGEAARLRPDIPEFREYVALFVEATGDPERTEKAWRDCVDRFPGHGRGWRRLGDLLVNRGSFEDAIEAYEAAIEASSRGGDESRTELAVARNSLAWLLVTCPTQRLRDPSRAKRAAGAAVESFPEERSFWNTLGLALYRCGDLAGAVKALLESTRLDPAGGDAWDWYVLAMARWRQGKRDEARVWYEKARVWHEARVGGDEELSRLRAEAQAMLDAGEDD